MTERTKIRAAISSYDFVLKSGVTAEKGKIAVIDTADGAVTKATAAAGLIPIGNFARTVVGDGTLTVTVDFWDEISAQWWVNDGTAAVTAAMRGGLCYMKDDQTVSSDATTRSALGMVLAVDTAKGVLVYSAYRFAVDAT